MNDTKKTWPPNQSRIYIHQPNNKPPTENVHPNLTHPKYTSSQFYLVKQKHSSSTTKPISLFTVTYLNQQQKNVHSLP